MVAAELPHRASRTAATSAVRQKEVTWFPDTVVSKHAAALNLDDGDSGLSRRKFAANAGL
jgi:hypothetical protein